MRYAKKVIVVCCLLAWMTGCTGEDFDTYPAGTTDALADTTAQELSGTTGQAQQIYVDVGGEVQVPGVYCLQAEARVYDAVEAAGGFTAQAVPEAVNQARLLNDGEQILIPSKTSLSTTEDAKAGLVNINTADETQLMELPGIGSAKAADIVAYRTAHGAFTKPEDLMLVPGIKEGLYQRLKDKITI